MKKKSYYQIFFQKNKINQDQDSKKMSDLSTERNDDFNLKTNSIRTTCTNQFCEDLIIKNIISLHETLNDLIVLQYNLVERNDPELHSINQDDLDNIRNIISKLNKLSVRISNQI